MWPTTRSRPHWLKRARGRGQDGTAVWLAPPGAALVVPPGTQVLDGSTDLPGAHLLDLVVTMDRLRRNCPWDARQTHESLAPYLLEETYEALDALESGDQEAFREELGDVLLQVAFHARVAAEREDGTGYTIDDVADGIVAKLVRRHPHVFADVLVSGADEVTRNWDDIKQRKSRRNETGPNGPGRRSPQPPRLPLWTECRSASPPWRWPRSCSAGPSERGSRVTWSPCSTATPMALAGICSAWSPGPGPQGVIPRWSCARPRDATAISCATGNAPDPRTLFRLPSTLVLNGIASDYSMIAVITFSYRYGLDCGRCTLK